MDGFEARRIGRADYKTEGRPVRYGLAQTAGFPTEYQAGYTQAHEESLRTILMRDFKASREDEDGRRTNMRR